MSEQTPLEKLQDADTDYKAARHKRDQAIKWCVDSQISNVKIALTLGVSETAVRTYKQRRGW